MPTQEKGIVLTRQNLNGEEILYPMTTLSMVKGNEALLKKTDENLTDAEKEQIKSDWGIKEGYFKPTSVQQNSDKTLATLVMDPVDIPGESQKLLQFYLPKGPQGPQGPAAAIESLALGNNSLFKNTVINQSVYNGENQVGWSSMAGIDYKDDGGSLREIKEVTYLKGSFTAGDYVHENFASDFYTTGAIAIPSKNVPVDDFIPDYENIDPETYLFDNFLYFDVPYGIQQSCVMINGHHNTISGKWVTVKGYYRVAHIYPSINDNSEPVSVGTFSIGGTDYIETSETGWKYFEFSYVPSWDYRSIGFWQAYGRFCLYGVTMWEDGKLIYNMNDDPYLDRYNRGDANSVLQMWPKNGASITQDTAFVVTPLPGYTDDLTIIDLRTSVVTRYMWQQGTGYSGGAPKKTSISLFDLDKRLLPEGGYPGQVLTVLYDGSYGWVDPQLPSGATTITVNDPNPNDPDYSDSGSITLL